MSRLIRRTHADDGIVALLVALFVGAGVLTVLAALVIDIGAMQLERRQLQNGAEAAAVTAAYECSMAAQATYGCGNRTPAITVASHNARDGASAVVDGDLCGKGGQPALLPCNENTRSVRNCPNPFVTGVNGTQVTASTLSSGGSSFLPQFFSQVVPGFGPRTITACAQAQWGPPGAFDGVIGIAIDKACWDAWVAAGAGYGPSSYTNASTWEHILRFGGGSAAVGNCVGTSVSSMGFGWLATTNNCMLDTARAGSSTIGAWLYGDSGNNIPTTGSPNCNQMIVADALASTAGFERTKLAVPVFDCVYHVTNAGTPTNNCPTSVPAPTTLSNGVYYHVIGYASWYLTGYYATPSQRYPSSNAAPYTFTYDNLGANCSSSQTCISGWFARATLLSSATIGNQDDYGFNIVKLVG